MIELESLDLVVQGCGTGGYSVKAEGPGAEIASAPLDQASLAELGHDLTLIRAGTAGAAPLRRVGAALFQALFPPPVLVAYSAAQTQVGDEGGLRLRLRLPPELASLPWELLYHPPTFLAAGPLNPILRFVDLPQPPGPLAAQLPLRVLHLVARPEGKALPDGRGEAGQLGSVLADLVARGAVEIIDARSGNLAALQEGLDRGCHVLHFCGQAGLSGKEGHLLCEDGEGRALKLTGGQLAGFLRATTLRLAFLDASEPGLAKEGAAPLLVADALVRGGLAATIAHQAPMASVGGTAFATGFYYALLEGTSVDMAVGAGRSAVLARLGATGKEQGDWAAPVLFTSAPEGRLFALEMAAKETDRAEPESAWQISQETFAQGDAATIGAVRGGQVNIHLGDAQATRPDMPPLPDDTPYAAIRALLLDAYTPTTLRTFCQDRPAFRPVVNDFGPGQGLNQMVARVLDYCRTQFLWAELLAAVQKDNPRQYARYEDRLQAIDEGLPPRPGVAPAPPVDPLLACLKELRTTVRDFAPREQRTEALVQVATLREASAGQDLDLAAMAGVLSWFEEELPALSGAALSAILTAKPRAEAAGDEILLEFQERFDDCG